MFTDTETGELLDVFHNRFTDETVKVKHFATSSLLKSSSGKAPFHRL